MEYYTFSGFTESIGLCIPSQISGRFRSFVVLREEKKLGRLAKLG